MNKEDIYNIVPKEVLIETFSDFKLGLKDGIHGFSHWARVIDNGLFLAEENGANKNIIIAFGLFHDIKREFDDYDPKHGHRGSILLDKYRDKINLSDEEIDKAIEACAGHTGELHHDDLDIATCWDSDRLDLYRVGVYPNKFYLNNEFAKEDYVIEARSELAEYEEIPYWAEDIIDEIINPILEKRQEKQNKSELKEFISGLEEFNPWIEEENTVKIKLYHGTTEDKVEGILKEGLKSVVDDPNWFMLSSNFGGALYHSNADSETNAVVLEIDLELPKPENDFFWNGYPALYPEYRHDNNKMSWFSLSDIIPADTIKAIHIVSLDSFHKQKVKGFEDLSDYELNTKELNKEQKRKPITRRI